MEQAMGQGAMVQGVIDGSGSNGRINGWRKQRRNWRINVTNGETEGAMDQGAIEWAMDATSGEIEGAMDQGASFE
jgi:hypothetical protein